MWHAFDDEIVVFNCASDDTHILNPFSAEVLSVLEERSANLTELAERIGVCFAIRVDDHLEHQLLTLLDELEQQDLIERTSDGESRRPLGS